MAQIKISAVKSALEKCAPGYSWVPTMHKVRVSFKGKTYPSFPVGSHGSTNPEIQLGHVRQLARHLNILSCFKRVLPQL